MKEFPVKVERVPRPDSGIDMWLLICEECPLSAKIGRRVPCMSGAYIASGDMVRLGPVCDYTKEDACTRGDIEGPRTHQHCWYDDGGIHATVEEHLKFGHVVIRHATPEEAAARIAAETGETEHHSTEE